MKWSTKVISVCLLALLLMYVGLRGSQQARLRARLDDLSQVRDQLQQRLDDEQSPSEPLVGGTRGTNTNAGRPRSVTPETAALARVLKTRLEQLNLDSGQGKVFGMEDLEVRLSKATLANAEQRFVDALTIITAKDEQGNRSDSQDPIGLRVSVLQVRGDSFYGLREWQSALDHYRPMLAQRPNRMAALARVADCLYGVGRSNEALTASEDLAHTHTKRGDAFLIQGRPDAALGHYQKAIELQTRLIEQAGRKELAIELARSHDQRGNASLLLGNGDPAIAHYEKAIEIFTRLVEQQGRSELAGELALSCNNRGNAFFAQGKLEPARGDYEKALEIQTRLLDQGGRSELANDVARGRHNLGNTLLVQQKLDAAIGQYDRAIEIQTRLVEQERRGELANELARSHNNRGVARRAQGKPDGAIGDFEKAIQIATRVSQPEGGGERGTIQTNRRAVLRPQVKLDVGLAYSDKSIDALIRNRLVEQVGQRQLDVVLALSLKNRGYSYFVQGKWDAALGDFRKAMEIYAKLVQLDGQSDLKLEFARSLSPLAWILATHPDNAIRDGNRAKAYALKACEISEWKAIAPVETLAAACAETGDFAEAARWQEKAFELAPAKNKAELRSRLDLYKSGKPYRAPLTKAE